MTVAEPTPGDLLDRATAALESGRADEALALCDRRMRFDPRDPEALHLSGLAHHLLGRHDEAVQRLEEAIRQRPENAAYHEKLGGVFVALKRFAEAEACLRRAVEIAPANTRARAVLGDLLLRVGRLDEAAACYQELLGTDAASASVLLNLGIVRTRQGRYADAAEILRAAARAAPQDAGFWARLGAAHLKSDSNKEALAAFDEALRLDGRHARALTGRARALFNLRRGDAAVAAFEAAAAAAPDDATVGFELGLACEQAGNWGGATAAFSRAYVCDPTLVKARWAELLALPRVYETAAEIGLYRRHWSENLAVLDAELRLATPAEIAAAVAATTSVNSFNLAYHGCDDRPLQERFGRLLHRVATARYPQYAAPPRRHGGARRRPRVGFVSAYLWRHSIWKTHGAWITRTSKDIEKVVYYAGGQWDDCVRQVRDAADIFVHEPRVERLIDVIAGHRPDVLVYLDHGMSSALQLPAALWLAPVQCNGLGHPVTSGLPTMTHALSSALMEPADGETQYSETLVRLPNSASCYASGELLEILRKLAVTRPDDGRVRFLCAQMVQKYLPQHDHVLAEIAHRLPAAEFHFIANRSAPILKVFEGRLRRAFAARGLDMSSFCRFHPYLDTKDFLTLNLRCDIFLDGTSWSGNNTAHEAIACGLPIVTLPGPLMRARHCFALLRLMEPTAAVAGDLEEYISLAVRLGADAERRRDARDRVTRHGPRVFNDMAPIHGLDRFLAEQAPG